MWWSWLMKKWFWKNNWKLCSRLMWFWNAVIVGADWRLSSAHRLKFFRDSIDHIFQPAVHYAHAYARQTGNMYSADIELNLCSLPAEALGIQRPVRKKSSKFISLWNLRSWPNNSLLVTGTSQMYACGSLQSRSYHLSSSECTATQSSLW